MGAPTRSGSSHTLWGPLRSVSSHNIRGPFRLFPHNMGVLLRSVSSHTTWGPPSAQFLHILYGGPLRSVSSHTTWGPPQINFFTYYMMARPSDQFILKNTPPPPPNNFVTYYIVVPRISFSHTIWGPINHFCHCMGAPTDQYLRILYEGLLLR